MDTFKKRQELNFEQAMKYIQNAPHYGNYPGLSRIKQLLDQMGNPQRKLRYVHIAGTNGKGSTAEFIRSILHEAGYKVGTYTSPDIHRVNERIKVGETEISNIEIARITSEIVEILSQNEISRVIGPSPFELWTTIAFRHFDDQNCDIVVLETGLGGRLDATNIIDTSEVSVITAIGMDHTDELGNTLKKIAIEKAGIVKDNGNVVLYQQDPEIMRVIDSACWATDALLTVVNFDQIHAKNNQLNRQVFDFEDLHDVEIGLNGRHQIRNAAVAISAIKVLRQRGFHIDDVHIRNGLSVARWPGRLEVMKTEPLFVVDGAHNPPGVETLANNLLEISKGNKITFIVGIIKSKDYKAMLNTIKPIAKRVIFISPDTNVFVGLEELENSSDTFQGERYAAQSVEQAIEIALLRCGKDDVICSFGSLYYIGQVRNYFGYS